MGQACVKMGLEVKCLTSSNPEPGGMMSARGNAKSMDFTNINGQQKQLLQVKALEGNATLNFKYGFNNDYHSNFKVPQSSQQFILNTDSCGGAISRTKGVGSGVGNTKAISENLQSKQQYRVDQIQLEDVDGFAPCPQDGIENIRRLQEFKNSLIPRQNSNTLSVGDLPGSKVVKRFKKVKLSGETNANLTGEARNTDSNNYLIQPGSIRQPSFSEVGVTGSDDFIRQQTIDPSSNSLIPLITASPSPVKKKIVKRVVIKRKKTSIASQQDEMSQISALGTDGCGAASQGNIIARGDSMAASNFDQYSRFDSAGQPSQLGGMALGIEYSRFNSGKTGSIITASGQQNDLINRIDSYKQGSISGNDYGRIDSTKLGSSNAVSSADISGNNKNLSFSINKTSTDLHSQATPNDPSAFQLAPIKEEENMSSHANHDQRQQRITKLKRRRAKSQNGQVTNIPQQVAGATTTTASSQPQQVVINTVSPAKRFRENVLKQVNQQYLQGNLQDQTKNEEQIQNERGKDDPHRKPRIKATEAPSQDYNLQQQITSFLVQQTLEEDDSPINYCKGELVGQGAYGKVYQGLDTSNGQLLAIKSIQFSLKPEQLLKEIKAIKHEIKMLKTLDHPNIVKYYQTDLSKDGKGVDIVLQFVPGGSIRQLLDKYNSFEEKLVKYYTRQMLDGLKYLHLNGIIHRDLKSANVLVDNMGVIKLSDFGASKKIMQNFDTEGLLENESLSKTFIGSPYWMAPEVIRKTGHGKPADIWSIGCCVIEMLTSKPPWSEHGRDGKVIMKTIISQERPPKYPEFISEECRQFLDYCFEQDQTKRPTAEELLYHPFVHIKNSRDPLAQSIEAAKLLQSHVSLHSSSLNNSNFFASGFAPPQAGAPPMFKQSNSSLNSIQVAFNSQMNIGQFLQVNNNVGNNNIRSLDNTNGKPNPLLNSGLHIINGNSINSINSIHLGGFDHSVASHTAGNGFLYPQMHAGGSESGGGAQNSMHIQNTSMLQGSLLNKSNGSAGSARITGNTLGGGLSFADKLKAAYERQRQERQESIIQNWVRNNQRHNQKPDSRGDSSSNVNSSQL